MTESDPWDDIFRSQPEADSGAHDEDTSTAPQSRRDARAAEGRRARGAGSGSARAPRRRWPWVLLGVVTLVLGLLGGAAAYVWANYESQVRELLGWELPNDYEGSGNGVEIAVVIRPGDIGEDVARTLQQSGVTMSFTAFYELLLADSSIVLFPGTYLLQGEMSAQAALDVLRDPANRVTASVTIPEGTTIIDALGLLALGTEIPFAEFEAAAVDPTVFGIPAEAPSLEGYLFPATYEFEPGLTATQVIQVLVDEMFARLDARGVAPEDRHRILTMAGLVQREAGPNIDDFGKIARVFYNRLDAGWRLESDATVAYGTGNFSTVWTTDAERADASNPYNTYANDGLPIGPIGLPGEVAIDAAISPTEGPWFFFVPTNLKTGETVFTATVDEHEAAVEQLRQWCRASEENAAYCE